MVEQTETVVTARPLRLKLLRVETFYGHQLVCGGRLVSETRFGEVHPHPELPVYTRELFPCDFDRWAEANGTLVATDPERLRFLTRGDPNLPKEMKVDVVDSLRDRKIGPVLAALHLFTVYEPQEIVAWLRSKSTAERRSP